MQEAGMNGLQPLTGEKKRHPITVLGDGTEDDAARLESRWSKKASDDLDEQIKYVIDILEDESIQVTNKSDKTQQLYKATQLHSEIAKRMTARQEAQGGEQV